MSWIERVNTDLKITTGDTAQYYPFWVNAQKSKEFNNTEFLFRNVSGTLVDRRLPKGRRYSVEMFFQGEDYIDVSDRFDKSSNNPKAWTIEHPIYGQIVVQPIGLSFDNSQLNTTKITGTLVETIGSKAIKTGVSAPELIQQKVYNTNVFMSEDFGVAIPEPPVSLLQAMTANVNAAYAAISSQIAKAQDAIDYTNEYNQANTLINNTVYDITDVIGQVQTLLLAPATFSDTVLNRLLLAQQQFAAIIIPPSTATPDTKQLYQNNAAVPILCMCLASITQYDYGNRSEVINAVDTITDTYNSYIVTLDTLQTATGGDLNSYIPSPDVILKLSDTVAVTIAALYEISEQSRQQRTIFLPEDMTLVQAAYKYFGLVADDTTITTMITTNNIGRVEYLLLKKNRAITYTI